MSLDKCPQCGWVHPPKVRKRPASYANNVTPVEVNFHGQWEAFQSVAEASRVTGIKPGILFRALRKGSGAKLQVRLAHAVQR